MDKNDAIKIITRSVKLYKNNLMGKRFLFVYNLSGSIMSYEAYFFKRNFHHLTGTKLNNCSVNNFFNKAISNTLKHTDFEFADDGTTPMKLQVLEQLMNIHKCARMIGKYQGPYVRLYTDTVTGTISGCLGFAKENENKNVPNTALNMDIRTATQNQYGNVITIFYCLLNDKNNINNKYTNVSMCKKEIDVFSYQYPEDIKEKILWSSLSLDFKK